MYADTTQPIAGAAIIGFEIMIATAAMNACACLKYD
jgi:hypothetical protein